MDAPIIPFDFHGHGVRVILRDGEPWFIAKDLCDVLDIGNTAQALSRLDDDEKGITTNDTLRGKQDMAIVSEPGMYQLVLTSRKPIAKELKRWLCHEVIPSIRKTGGYSLQKTPIQLLAETTAYMAEMERIQAQHSQAIDDLQIEVKEIGSELARFTDGDGHYMSIIGFANCHGLEVDRSQASEYGKQASRLCRERGIQPKQVADTRFGKVNTYPQSVLRAIFEIPD